MPQTHATALFAFSLQRQDSLVAGKNFITLFNPSTSGKTMAVGSVFLSHVATVAGTSYPMRGYRTSVEPTGGTLHAESEICRFDSQRFAPAAVIRSGNPTVTLGAAFFNAPSQVVKDTIGPIEQIDAPAGFNPFLLYPGEGFVARQDVGAVGVLWNLSIVWRELRG